MAKNGSDKPKNDNEVLPENLLSALKQYFGIFNSRYDFNSVLKSLSMPPTYTYGDFREDFKEQQSLQHLIRYIRDDNDLDSSIANRLETTFMEGGNANTSIKLEKQITPEEGELLKQYLIHLAIVQPILKKLTEGEITKIDEGQYGKINLNQDVYKLLLNYCALYPDAVEDKQIFRGLLDRANEGQLEYSRGPDTFDGRNLKITSNLTPLALAAHNKFPGSNDCAYILAQYGYGVTKLDHGTTIIHLAMLLRNDALLKRLPEVEGFDIYAEDENGHTALSYLIEICEQDKASGGVNGDQLKGRILEAIQTLTENGYKPTDKEISKIAQFGIWLPKIAESEETHEELLEGGDGNKEKKEEPSSDEVSEILCHSEPPPTLKEDDACEVEVSGKAAEGSSLDG